MISQTASTIGIRAVGKVDSEVLAHLVKPIEDAFGRPPRIGPSLEEPAYAYNPRRGQYLATAVLQRLAEARLPDEEKLLGVTAKDLFVPQLNFVFGMADPSSNVAVVSLVRLRPEFYSQASNRALFFERAVKEALHELGHTYSLPHCPDPSCVMYFSNSIEDTDRKQARFCPHCRP